MATVVQTTTNTPGYPRQQQQQVYITAGGYQPQQQQVYTAGGYQPQHQQVYTAGGYQPQQQQPVQIVPQQTTNSTTGGSSKYNAKAGLVTGILQICAGGSLVLLGIISLLGSAYGSGWEIWGGILFYIVTGGLGVASKKKNKCVIVAYMVMCIISALSAGGQMFYDIAGAIVNSIDKCDDYIDWHHDERVAKACDYQSGLVVTHSLAAVIGFCEMIIAIVASAYCCCGVCGRTASPTQMTVVYAPAYPQNAHVGQVTVDMMTHGSYPAPGTYTATGTYPQNPEMPPAYQQQPVANALSQQEKSAIPN